MKNIILCSLFIFIGYIEVYAQYSTSHEIINYGPKDYLTHNQNWQTVQDDRGMLFFANGDGILQYDGTFWDYTPSSTLTNILSLGINSKGVIYYGGIGELGYLAPSSNGKYKAIEILPEAYKDAFSSEFFWSVHIFGDTVIHRSERYLVFTIKDKVKVYKSKEGKIKNSISTSTEVWIQKENKQIYWFHPNDPQKQFRLTEPLISGLTLAGVFNIGNKKMFVGAQGEIYVYDPEKNTSELYASLNKNGIDLNIISSRYLSNGELILCTSENGVFVLNKNGEKKFHYYSGNGLSTNLVRNVFQDREGILWLTTNEGISKVLYNIPYTTLNKEGSALKGISNSIIKINEKIYVATSEGVYIISEKESITSTKVGVTKVKNLNYQCFDLVISGNEIICASPSGLFVINNDSAVVISNSYTRAIAVPEGSKNQIIVGGKDQVLFLEKSNGLWQIKHRIINFPDEVLHIEQDLSVNDKMVFWAGLYSIGIVRIECTKEFSYTGHALLGKKNGVDEGYILPFQIAKKMYFIPKKPGGVYNFNSNTSMFLNDDVITPLFGEQTSSWLIKEDKVGNVIFENQGPLYFLRKNKNNYNVDSLSLSTLNLDFVNDIFIDNNGVYWITGGSGIARYDPRIMGEFNQKYHVLLKQITINRDSILFNHNFFINGKASIEQSGRIHELDYSYNSLSFEFAAIYFNGSEKTKYSYQLVGYDPEFSKWNKENKAVYTNLKEGKYTFNVKAKNIYQIESEVLSYRFVILPPWYKTIWAYLVYCLISILLIILVSFLISFRLRRANERLKLLVDEKTSEIVQQRDELANQKEVLIERNREITDSITYAKRIQNAILPSSKLVQEHLKKSFVLYKPKDIVAGDFYWMEHLDDRVLFAAADCTGHGVPGAMVSVVCNNALNRSVREHELTDPGEILNRTREIVVQEFEKSDDVVKDGMDIALCSLKENELKYAGANNPLWIIRRNKLIETAANKQPIGKFDNPEPYTTHTFELQKGDSIYIFSDGYVDQFGGTKGKKLKAKAFRELLLSIQNKEMEEQKNILDKTFEIWKGDLEQIDDVCVIGVKI